jgi:long-chain acyl-CoA synthetase
VAQFLLERAIRLGERQIAGKGSLKDMPVSLLLNATLRPKVKARFGGRVKALVSGRGAAQSRSRRLLPGDGPRHAAGLRSDGDRAGRRCNYPSAGIALHTVGPPLMGVEVRIAEDGEILVRGELVMKGYWKNPEATKAALPDDWLRTGDIGHIDERGRIVITDRKKDIIVNDKGDNIAPQKLEGMLTLQPEIAQAMVSGDKRPHMVALVVPDAEWAKQWAKDNACASAEIAALREHPAFLRALKAAVDRTNQDLSVIEKIRRFTVADEPFSVDNGQMTPTMKIRRNPIRAVYQERLDALY